MFVAVSTIVGMFVGLQDLYGKKSNKERRNRNHVLK
ncbi:hypothetical protein J2S21_001460 [Peribacillus cavernae]|nr:hypothetical protein [Peribacillus cavernae]